MTVTRVFPCGNDFFLSYRGFPYPRDGICTVSLNGGRMVMRILVWRGVFCDPVNRLSGEEVVQGGFLQLGSLI